MKDLTLKFVDRADFSAFMESIGYYDDESMQDDILIDVIGNVYKNRQYSINTRLLLSINFVAGCEGDKWLHRQ